MSTLEVLFIVLSLTLFVFLYLIAVDKIYNFVEKKLYKKPFYNYTASEIMKKYGISEAEYLLLKEELDQHRLFNKEDSV